MSCTEDDESDLDWRCFVHQETFDRVSLAGGMGLLIFICFVAIFVLARDIYKVFDRPQTAGKDHSLGLATNNQNRSPVAGNSRSQGSPPQVMS